MKTYTKDELAAILDAHAKWLHNEAGGSRADLSGANLSRANLSRAVHAWSQVAFRGHGECGRMLTAVIFKEGEAAVYQCGCFSGSLAELMAYINGRGDKAGSGAAEHIPSRTRAMEIATELLTA